jgi:hypothetical protein
MSSAELKMQPTIHWNVNLDKYSAFSPDVLWVAFLIHSLIISHEIGIVEPEI